MFEVELSPEASEFYRNADPPLAKKLARCFGQLEVEPRRHNNVKRLSGTEFAGCLRFRVGDWRVIFEIDELKNRVHVLTIAHRREVYE
jgi:mRNA interferase RelE/StbE